MPSGQDEQSRPRDEASQLDSVFEPDDVLIAENDEGRCVPNARIRPVRP